MVVLLFLFLFLSTGEKSLSGGNILTPSKSIPDDAAVRPSNALFVSPDALFPGPESWKSGA